MEKVIQLKDKLETKILELEDTLKEKEDEFDQTMARITIKKNHGQLTENDLEIVLDALRKHSYYEETITDEIIRLGEKLEKY